MAALKANNPKLTLQTENLTLEGFDQPFATAIVAKQPRFSRRDPGLLRIKISNALLRAFGVLGGDMRRLMASAEDWISGKIRHLDELDIRSAEGDFMLDRLDIGWAG